MIAQSDENHEPCFMTPVIWLCRSGNASLLPLPLQSGWQSGMNGLR
jgi:hypothetical protein